MALRTATLSERPDLAEGVWAPALMSAWPRFMSGDPVADWYFGEGAFEHWHDWVILAWEENAPSTVVARACSVPFAFGTHVQGRADLPSGGWDTVIRWADEDRRLAHPTNAASALDITVRPQHQGRGLSRVMLRALRDNARQRGAATLFAPVRPSHKHWEPDVSMTEYAFRTCVDGLPHDPWLRVHVREGGRIVSVAPTSMVIAGSLCEWHDWTDLSFEQDGPVGVPGALVPVYVSVRHNHAVYVEPGVWVRHDL